MKILRVTGILTKEGLKFNSEEFEAEKKDKTYSISSGPSRISRVYKQQFLNAVPPNFVSNSGTSSEIKYETWCEKVEYILACKLIAEAIYTRALMLKNNIDPIFEIIKEKSNG
jgi:hypothetical protein